MRRDENIVAALIEHALPGSRMEPVHNQSAGEWDFNLVIGDRVSPVEVTRSTSQRMEGFHAAIFGEDGEQQYVERKRAAHPWMITASPLSNVRKLRARADRLLADIEAEGRTEFNIARDSADSSAVLAIWNAVRISDGEQMTDVVSTHHQILTPIDSAILSSEQVIAAVEREAHKSDNRAKLERSSAAERHLFVQIDHLGYPAKEAMRVCGLPYKPLALPSEITHVWVSSHVGLGEEYLVWRFDHERGWADFGVVDLAASSAPDA